MLEDDFTWVIRKALKGHALAPGEAAKLAGLPEKKVMAFTRGDFSEDTARQLAPVLGLNPAALANHDIYQPHPISLPGVRRIDLPFGGERVNAWLIEAGGVTVLFDTGHERGTCAAAASDKLPGHVFITHGHRDHVGGITDFMGTGAIIRGLDIPNTRQVNPGDSIRCGPLTIRSCDLSGHYTPALGYHVKGLAKPVLVTGDALFAGSIGGCATPELYQRALRRLAEVLSPLPDETVLLPGHGPATTLGEERASNPFL